MPNQTRNLTHPLPEVFADACGVWRRDDPDREADGIAWDDIYALDGYKVFDGEQTLLFIEFDWDYGEFFEMYAHFPGFAQVAEAVTNTLPGIAPDWLQTNQELHPPGLTISVWRRADT